MNWIVNTAILAGISADVFASMECQGSLVADINKKHLYQIGIFGAVWQAAALFLGSLLSGLIYSNEMAHDEKFVGLILAVLIFFGLGMRFVKKAVKNEQIQEHLEKELGFQRFINIGVSDSIYTLAAGLALGFLRTDLTGRSLLEVSVLAAVLTFFAIVMGMYTGYHFGFAHKTKAYIFGAVLLWFGGIKIMADIILDYFV